MSEKFSLGAIAGGREKIEAIEVLGAIAALGDARDLEDAAHDVLGYAAGIYNATDHLEDALGAIEMLGAIVAHPRHPTMRRAAQASTFAALERLRALVSAGTGLQAKEVMRPNVFLFVRFTHPGAGLLTINDLKPSLPGQQTWSGEKMGPLSLIQARTWLKAGAWANADVNIKVSRIDAIQLGSPAGGPTAVGLPIEFYAPHAYRPGIQPPAIRGLERADSNTVITWDSTATAAVTYDFGLEFRMLAVLGGPCGRVLPSLIRGPMNIRLRS